MELVEFLCSGLNPRGLDVVRRSPLHGNFGDPCVLISKILSRHRVSLSVALRDIHLYHRTYGGAWADHIPRDKREEQQYENWRDSFCLTANNKLVKEEQKLLQEILHSKQNSCKLVLSWKLTFETRHGIGSKHTALFASSQNAMVKTGLRGTITEEYRVRSQNWNCVS